MQQSNEVYNLTPLEEEAVRKGIFSAENERSYSVDEAFDFARKHFSKPKETATNDKRQTNSDLPKPSNKPGTKPQPCLLKPHRGSNRDGTGD
ncbi:MAG: hypothetical protein QE269_10755 [Fimbriimonas sp.]|nr:hypothetical protein [Fimbriimonas sp.]